MIEPSRAHDNGATADPASQGIRPTRGTLQMAPGAFVSSGSTTYRVSEVLDFERLVGIEVESGRSVLLSIQDLSPAFEQCDEVGDLDAIGDKDWRLAERRLSVIRPLVEGSSLGRTEIEKLAADAGVDAATVYRWIKSYRATGSVVSLIEKKRGWRDGRARIDSAAERVIQAVIAELYLTPQRPTTQKAIIEVFRRCHEQGIVPPSAMTIRRRIESIPERDKLRGRGFRDRAINRFLPAAGSFPGADFPLAVVQIDHTPVDLILVDDVHRKPIGRPWITLAIEVYSRMVAGYYLSFDPPSETSVAMCVAHAILPKDEWLMLHKIDAKWPVWGVPVKIHVDNGADFRSDSFQKSCLAQGIHVEYRPVKQPRYGGHIERLLGTLLREIHDLPGTTFSSIKEREGYDSEKHAVLTKSEFEEWLVGLICRIYHERKHSSLGVSPLKKWEIGVFGNGETPGVGLQPRPADRHRVLLDFLPACKRTIQTFGARIDGMNYYAEALRPWINALDPENTDKKREFIFRRDPRDISAVWFFDPELKEYFKVPFADQSLPSMSIWEYRQAQDQLRKAGHTDMREPSILRALTELRTQVDDAKERTKRARRQAQRRKEHEKRTAPILPAQPAPESSKVNLECPGLLETGIVPYGDIA